MSIAPQPSLTLNPVSHISGEVTLPGSKSLSNRILLLAALAKGETRISNLLDSDDVRHMLNALRALGVSYTLSDDKSVCVVQGRTGVLDWDQPLTLFLGNAGTAMRPLTAALAASHGEFELTGEPRMAERPIKDLVDALAGWLPTTAHSWSGAERRQCQHSRQYLQSVSDRHADGRATVSRRPENHR
jgi:3-phosphoshikimate 1-carboxyvinyltransferase